METVNIRELNLNDIYPNDENYNDPNIGRGMKILVLGKPNCGKSVLIKTLLASKRHLIPVGVVVSGSEIANNYYNRFFPDLFIYDKYDASIIKNIEKRQETAIKHGLANKWAVFVMDDCMSDHKAFQTEEINKLMKNSRHWNLLTIVANQNVLDLLPRLRTMFDGFFIFRESSEENRKKIHRNFASIIPKEIFFKLMDDMTQDYTALYIDNSKSTNDWKDCVFYYKAPYDLPDLRFGCDSYWRFAEDRKI